MKGLKLFLTFFFLLSAGGFLSGCDDETNPSVTTCSTKADCTESSEECRFLNLNATTGVCVALTTCSTDQDCNGRKCLPFDATTSYCGYTGDVDFAIKTATLPNGVVGKSYSFSLEVEGVSAPFHFELKDGSLLPQGLTLSRTGAITGTPTTVVENHQFTVIAINGEDNSPYYFNDRVAEAVLSITIIENDPCADVTCEGNSHCEDGECLCDDNFHEEGESCVSNTKTVSCQDAAPANATSVITTVTINWTDENGWSDPAVCEWNCKSGYELDNGVCIAVNECADFTCGDNSQCEIQNGSPVCVCDTNFHKDETEACVSNSKMVNCIDVAPEHATSTLIEVEIIWNGTEWSTAPNCAWECNQNYHNQDGSCVFNTQTVDCRDLTTVPSNAHQVESQVEVNWNGTQWETPAYCEWECNANYILDNGVCITETACANFTCEANSHCEIQNDLPVCVCDQDFHKDETEACISNSKMVDCLDAAPANATSSVVEVEVTWNGTDWNTASNCEWNCFDTFERVDDSCVCPADTHLADNSCASNTKTESCVDAAPENATSTITDVEVTWNTTTNSWNTTPNCEWSCVDGFYKNGSVCSAICETMDAFTAEYYENYGVINSIRDEAYYLESVNATYDNLNTQGLNCLKVEDWYVLDIPAGYRFRTTINFTHANGDLDLRIYKNDETTYLNSAGSTNSETLSTDVLVDATYYISVRYGLNTYSMTISLEEICTVNEDCEANELCEAGSCVPNLCYGVTCGEHSTCSQTTGDCVCDSGYYSLDGSCVNPCETPANTCDALAHELCVATGAETFNCACEDGYTKVGDECVMVGGNGTDTCTNSTIISSTGVWTGTTVGATNDYTLGSGSCTGYPANGLDVVYQVELNAGDQLQAVLTGTTGTGDLSLYLISDCSDDFGSCVAGSDENTGLSSEEISFTATTSMTYFIVVDAYSSTAGYNFELDVLITRAVVECTEDQTVVCPTDSNATLYMACIDGE
ncbi:pre-peptidase C-terminal domain-containing protein, partial [bacterium]|nr:pre-peptidase C-terminal domain-containing protein [bacterium]